MKYNFFDIEVQEFEAEHGERLKKEWIEDSKGFSSYRDYVVNSFLNETWNNLSEDQKTEIALKAHGNDTPMKRITADVDSISSYSCISKITKQYFQSLK